MLEFLIDHHEHGPIGVTGLSELSARDRRATVGTWFGRDYWGRGANPSPRRWSRRSRSRRSAWSA